MKKIMISIWLLSSIIIISQTKKVMVEIFTSTTCGPCAVQNPAFDNWLRNFANKDNVVVMKYHVWWPAPGNDPYYLANTSDPQSRKTFYNTNAVPNCYVDGVDYSYNYTSWVNGISSKLTSTSLFNIKTSGIKTGNDFDVNIKIDASAALPQANYVLHVGVVESELIYTGPNGDPRHEQVLRKMYPDATGEIMNIQPGQTKYFTRKISWNSNWKVDKSELVVFIQSNSTKTIMQASKSTMQNLTSIKENEKLPAQFILSQNFPNPFNPTTTIQYVIPSPIDRSSNLLDFSSSSSPRNDEILVTLKVFDFLGREVATLVNELKQPGSYTQTFNVETRYSASLQTGYTSGIYFYQLKAGRFTETKKMLLVK